MACPTRMLKRLPRRVTPRYPVGLLVERISRTPSYSVGSASAPGCMACMAAVLGRGRPAAAGAPSCGRLAAAAAAAAAAGACMRSPSCWLSNERLTGSCWPVLVLVLGLAAAARPAACLLVLAAACLLVLAAGGALSGWAGLVERLTGLVERLTGPV